MSSMQDRLERADTWLERQNALHDQILESRPTWWHAGKLLLGLVLLLKSVAFTIQAVDFGDYALALVFLGGGLGFAGEAVEMLYKRWRLRS